MKCCMIDIETLGLSIDTHILAVGAVIIDTHLPLDQQPSNHFYAKLPWKQPGRVIDPGTVAWHIQKTATDTLRENFTDKNRHLHLTTFPIDFLAWYNYYKPETVWSKGVEFDISIIEHYYQNQTPDHKVPWHYRDRRCFRTILELAMSYPQVKERVLSIPGNTEDSKLHTALGDALSQAKTLWNIYQEFAKMYCSYYVPQDNPT